MTSVPASPGSVTAPSWSIRLERPIDLDQIHDLHREAFGGPDEAELVDAIRSGPDFLPELSLVAVAEDGSVLGHVMVSLVGFEPLDASSGSAHALALAPLAVLPAHAGRGIGSALTAAALEVADARDEPLVVVVGAPAFYGRFGFRPAADLAVDGPYADAGDAFQVRPRSGSEGTPSGVVVYPPAFGALRAG